MNIRASLLKDGPIVLMNRLASGYSQDSGADPRAQITLHTKNGKIWTGIPTDTVEDRSRSYIILEILPKKNLVVIDTFEIQTVEIENLDLIYSFLEKPWLKDSRFRSVTRLQFMREIETLWAAFPNQKLTVAVDTFPTSEETFGALLAWLYVLKAEVAALMESDLGKEALLEISQISIKGGTEALVAKKDGKTLALSVSLAKESFEKTRVQEQLNNSL